MTKPDTERKLTDDEMDALVIADVDDPEAWGEPILVHVSKSPRPAWMSEAKRRSGTRAKRPRRDR
jgi:hypothetical protein